ncbi:unknown [Coraliomargarita sp. CAG:312]|nr:unknown [Coraliomargarita sp. CAG:312]
MFSGADTAAETEKSREYPRLSIPRAVNFSGFGNSIFFKLYPWGRESLIAVGWPKSDSSAEYMCWPFGMENLKFT